MPSCLTARDFRVAPALLLALVAACGPSEPGAAGPMTRTYYVAAEEVEWDFAPAGRNLITDADWNDIQRPFVTAGDMHVGRLARKAIYREYTDSTFATLKPRPAEWVTLGFNPGRRLYCAYVVIAGDANAVPPTAWGQALVPNTGTERQQPWFYVTAECDWNRNVAANSLYGMSGTQTLMVTQNEGK